jgi:hypothetical protein
MTIALVTASGLAFAGCATALPGDSPAAKGSATLLRAGLVGQESVGAGINLDNCRLLAEGYAGGCASQLQAELRAYSDPLLQVDGGFGTATRQAVMNFQAAHQIAADGVVGPATKAALDTAATTQPAPVQVYVALGDSIPYGFGLANPGAGPSDQAYPSQVAADLGFTQALRDSNCTLTGDNLAVSGAVADPADAHPNVLCGRTESLSVNFDELPAAELAENPAALVTIQVGADDINFTDCLKWVLSLHRAGTQCVSGGQPTPAVSGNLAHLRAALASEIEQVAPYAQHVVVLNYYQPFPAPADIDPSTTSPDASGIIDPVCWLLGQDVAGSSAYAVALQAALNGAIQGAVQDASAGNGNVQLVDLSQAMTGHEMCTAEPYVFAGEPMPMTQFANDIWESIFPAPGSDAALDLTNHAWRVAHPNQYGQQQIASAIESRFVLP